MTNTNNDYPAHQCLRDSKWLAAPYNCDTLIAEFDSLLTQQQADRACLKELVEALEFYENAWSYKVNKLYGGLEYFPKEELLDDCGNTAKAALEKAKLRVGDKPCNKS